MKKYILSIDCGSQSMRAIIFDDSGEIAAMDQFVYEPYFSPDPGFSEQHAEMFFDSLCRVCRNVKAKAPDVFSKVEAVALTTQRDSCVFLGEDLKPVRPTILWMDQRKIAKPQPMGLLHTAALHLVGMYTTAADLNRACAAHWVQVNQPEIWEKTKKYVFISAYLNYRMTGILKDNWANQIGHVPLDYKRGKWESTSSLKGRFFQIDRDRLVELIPPATVLGTVTREAAELTGLPEGLPFIPAGSDKGCETLGAGCMDESAAAISLGSQATVQITSKRYFETLSFIPPFPAVVPGYYNPEIQIYRGFWMISWFKREFARDEMQKAREMGVIPEDLLNENLSIVLPGCDGLLLQPYWGSGIKTPEARGAIVGFSDVHTRAHIYRAIVEGIGFSLREAMEAIGKKSGVPITELRLSGGGSQSDDIAQIMADIFNLPVSRVQTHETSGLGAAIVGFCTIGRFGSFGEAVGKMVRPQQPFHPNTGAAGVYGHIYKRYYNSIYSSLRPLYKRMLKDGGKRLRRHDIPVS